MHLNTVSLVQNSSKSVNVNLKDPLNAFIKSNLNQREISLDTSSYVLFSFFYSDNDISLLSVLFFISFVAEVEERRNCNTKYCIQMQSE